MVRFDWYQATVKAPVHVVRHCLEALAEGPAEWFQARSAPHGYGVAQRLEDASGLVCQVWHGGTHAYPHAVITGELAQAASELLRAELPDHRVTRADSCMDFIEPGAYDRLQGLAVEVAAARRIKVGTAGDHLLTKEGRSVTLGARQSATYLRIYDKTAEQRSKFASDPVRLAAIPEHWTRLECEVKPQGKDAKEAAALIDPVSLMGSAAWMRDLMGRVAGMDLPPWQATKSWRQSDDDRTYAALLAQYGGVLRRKAEVQGWECLGLQLRDDLAARDAAKGKQR